MSAFIVADKTINQIVSFVNRDSQGMVSSPFRALGFAPTDTEQLERLARELHLLNCDAVDGRYGKGTAAHDVAVAFEFHFEPCPDPAGVYKLVSCLLYQCSEGDVPERHLFKALEQFAQNLAHAIISELPGYKATRWG